MKRLVANDNFLHREITNTYLLRNWDKIGRYIKRRVYGLSDDRIL